MTRKVMGFDRLGDPVYVGQEIHISPVEMGEDAYAWGYVCNKASSKKDHVRVYIVEAGGVWAKNLEHKTRFWSVPYNLLSTPIDAKRLMPCTELELTSLWDLGLDI